MFKIDIDESGTVFFRGKFVAGQTEEAERILDGLDASTVLDFGELKYMSSVGLGIAVDDTIHFLTWFRREFQSTGSRPEAIKRAFSHSATAMLQTTAVCGLGLASFVLADFVPTAQFAWMMIALLGLAIVGDQSAVPALAELLADEKLSAYARDALEAIPGSAPDAALREALSQLEGERLIDVLGSVGVRRDAEAIDVRVE